MQIKVHYVQEITVRSNIHRGREQAHRDLANNSIITRTILERSSKRTPVAKRYEVVFLIRGKHQPVGSIDVGGHHACMKLMVNTGAFRTKPDDCYLVGRFANKIYEILVVRRALSLNPFTYQREGKRGHRDEAGQPDSNFRVHHS